MVKLRGTAGSYETLDGRYRVERQDGITLCDHPMCDVLHQRFHDSSGEHWCIYDSWHVWDEERGDYAHSDSGHFDTKREAVKWLDTFLAGL